MNAAMLRFASMGGSLASCRAASRYGLSSKCRSGPLSWCRPRSWSGAWCRSRASPKLCSVSLISRRRKKVKEIKKHPFTDYRIGTLLADTIKYILKDKKEVSFKENTHYKLELSFEVKDEYLIMGENKILKIIKAINK